MTATRDLVAAASTEERTHRIDEHFRLLVESVKDYAIFMLDPAGVVRTWNPGAERLKGYRADEIVGKHFSTFYPPEDVAAGKPDRELGIAASEGRVEDEGWRVRKDGSTFWANVVITAVYDPDDQLRGFAKVTQDLTERRRADEERVKLAQAQEAIRLRDEFLSIASHELRTPLNALLLHAVNLDHLIRRQLVKEGSDSSGLLDKAAGVVRQGRRLNELIEGILDVSRLATGRLAIKPQPADLVAIVKDVIATYLPQAEQLESRIRLSTPASVPGLWDPLRVSQIVTNLLSNAIKYGRANPIDVIVEAGNATVRIVVRDHGIGIEPDRCARIFERFERGASPSDSGGLGLGLYIVERLVQAHGGRVLVESIVGEGSTFTVELPVGKDPGQRVVDLSGENQR